MKIQQINNQQYKNNYQHPKFTGAVDTAVQVLRFLDTNQAIGACAVDVGCMVAPRTITDFGRGANAGFETLRRESSGTLNHAAIGPVYGTLAGMLVASAVNSSYGIKAGNIFADSDATDLLSKVYYDLVHSPNNVNKDVSIREFYKNIASNIFANKKGTIQSSMSDNASEEFAKVMEQELLKHDKHNVAKLRNIVLSDLGVEKNLVLKYGEKEVVADADVLLKNITSLTPNFFKEKVKESFKNATEFAKVSFVNNIKKFGNQRSILGLLFGALVGCSIQPLNIFLTKRKTGSDGFVGTAGREKDNSNGFKFLKGASALAFTTFALATIGKPKNLLKNLQYRSLIPTLNQFKLVYGLTIASRLLVARDKDELRESAIKDTIGFSSWLLLGNLVEKYTLKALDKDLAGKTRDEILFSALKKNGISTIKDDKALSFKKLLSLLPKEDKITRGKLKAFNIAQLAGYAFSALVLGVGIPKLNIYMTKRSEQKRAKQRAINSANNMFKPENLAFLSNQMNFTSKGVFKQN